jgi:signal transduction histidine kinase
MILGEGSVFLLLLLIGAGYIRKFVLREQRLAKQERNFLLATTHEFNSPIAAIKLNLQTLQRRTVNPEQQQSILTSALSANQRLEILVSNILTASRLDAGRYEVMCENTTLVDVLKVLEQRFDPLCQEKKSSLSSQVEDTDLSIPMETRAFELVMGNLIENALKYAPGTPIKIHAFRSKDKVVVEVSDEGPGIDKEEGRNVFRKFYRSENEETRSQKGTGLGLYLVKQLLELHGAKLQLRNNQPSGCLFEMTFKANERGK